MSHRYSGQNFWLAIVDSMKDWLVQSQLTNKSETHVSCSPTTSRHGYFNPKRITTLNPPVHSI